MAAPMSEFSEKKTIEELVSSCLQTRKNVNNVIDIVHFMESSEKEVVIFCIQALENIYLKFLSADEMVTTVTEGCEEKGSSSKAEYSEWLREQYQTMLTHFEDKIQSTDKQIQKAALSTLMKFVEVEGQHPLSRGSNAQHFPEPLFVRIVQGCVSSDPKTSTLMNTFQEYLKYKDIRYFTLKFIHKYLKDTSTSRSDADFTNIFSLLESCCKPHTKGKKCLAVESLVKMDSQKEYTKLFTCAWLQFLSYKLPTTLYKQVLIILQDKVMPRLSNPLVLSDFLTESYNIGGVISLLALDSLFILINKFNLEYPQFYEKLYALLEPAVLHVKYRSRFFHLTDLFLTSTHLPAYLVAAFIKKVSRISLTAPSSALPVTIVFVCNLLKRHASCQVLINRPDGPKDLDADPYIYDEPDPSKCEALKSSLWEIKTLQNHFCPTVSQLASRINQPLHHTEDMLSDFLDITEEEMLEKIVKKRRKTVPVTFEKPKGLLGNKNDALKTHWVLE